jgi:hypothetical protein
VGGDGGQDIVVLGITVGVYIDRDRYVVRLKYVSLSFAPSMVVLALTLEQACEVVHAC